MGKDKALLPFQNFSTLSEFQYQKLQQWFDKVYLSAKTDKFPFFVKVIKDSSKESSPLVALISALEEIESDAIFILSVDTPMLTEDIIKKLWDAYKKDPKAHAYIAQSPSGIQPLCGIYKKSILSYAKINLNKNKHSFKALLSICKTKNILFKEDIPFTNLNTQDEYLKLFNNKLS
jgi:molybdopterin-guanine dinucleotide biosynthesis protein A